ncbi:hypothetical protein ACIA5G_52330 [Amycolatopsis sp. NPDC051758]|uniref:hypothetical protein n=1 Tax=Amycolatopsis sp. NPDC051758 TaxID=3363935 RepID=UPI003791993D
MITLPAILPGCTVIRLTRDRRGSAPARSGRRLAVVAAAVLGFVVSACSSGSADAPASSASMPTAVVPTATTASPASTAKQKAVDAYLGMWRDVAVVATTSDWRSPRLAEHATGDALSVLSRQLYADHYNGLISKGTPSNSPVAQSVDSPYEPKTVVISDCSDASTWLKYRADNGKPADDEPGGRHRINAEVKLAVDGSWRVTRFAVEGTGSC